MIERRLAVGEKLAEDRQQAAVEAHFTLPAEPRAELEDVAVETSPCRRFRRWDALHSLRVCSDHRRASFPAQVGGLGLPQNSETCCSSRPAPSGAPPSHGWLRGHVEFGLHPLLKPGAGPLSRTVLSPRAGSPALSTPCSAPPITAPCHPHMCWWARALHLHPLPLARPAHCLCGTTPVAETDSTRRQHPRPRPRDHHRTTTECTMTAPTQTPSGARAT
mmetsp:Transcript_31557/g.77789  ORF Transcript_31557/g.77789 Transcript_31557/m.77789 type:complete len:219 (+) Transcript_31557:1100-1756(+)